MNNLDLIYNLKTLVLSAGIKLKVVSSAPASLEVEKSGDFHIVYQDYFEVEDEKISFHITSKNIFSVLVILAKKTLSRTKEFKNASLDWITLEKKKEAGLCFNDFELVAYYHYLRFQNDMIEDYLKLLDPSNEYELKESLKGFIENSLKDIKVDNRLVFPEELNAILKSSKKKI